MQIEQLPRDEYGAVTGQWKLRHRSADFSEGFGAYCFENGETTAPLTGRVLERAIAALGEQVQVVPWDEPVARPVADTATLSPDDADDEGGGEPLVPTTRAELDAMSDEQLRATAASLGCTDKRWGALRLRRFIADELGMEEDDAEGQ